MQTKFGKKLRFVGYEIVQKLFDEKQTDEPAHLLVLLALVRYGKEIYPSIARIAHDTNYSERQIKRILKALSDKGVIKERKEQRRKTKTWTINFDALPDKPEFKGKQKRELGDEEIQAKGNENWNDGDEIPF